MNRIHSFADQPVALPPSSQSPTDPHPISENRSSIRATAVAHERFVPLHYEPGYAYPLVIWLHGPDDNEQQLKQIMPLISIRNYVGIAPRGTHTASPEDEAAGRLNWSDDSQGVLMAQDRVLECMDLATRRLNIHQQRIFLAGFGTGGTLALRLATSMPDLFAGVVSIGGRFPVGNSPLVHIEKVRQLPLLICHGRESTSYPEEKLCRDLRLIHVAGFNNVNLRLYPCGDEVTTKILSDIDGWTMELVTGVPSCSEPTPHPSEWN